MSGLGDKNGRTLLAAARAAIEERLGASERLPRRELEPRLLEAGASFVTLRIGDALRGCIGSLEPKQPLIEDVESNARAAAFRDYRFSPLEASELELVAVEVSVLSVLTPIEAANEAELGAGLRPGIDGVLLTTGGGRRATFLPQVWDGLPDAAAFLAQLRMKAGLPADSWEPDYRFFRYGVEKWSES